MLTCSRTTLSWVRASGPRYHIILWVLSQALCSSTCGYLLQQSSWSTSLLPWFAVVDAPICSEKLVQMTNTYQNVYDEAVNVALMQVHTV